MSNGSLDDEDASSKENCDQASGQNSDGAGSSTLTLESKLNSKKKGKFLFKLLGHFVQFE